MSNPMPANVWKMGSSARVYSSIECDEEDITAQRVLLRSCADITLRVTTLRGSPPVHMEFKPTDGLRLADAIVNNLQALSIPHSIIIDSPPGQLTVTYVPPGYYSITAQATRSGSTISVLGRLTPAYAGIVLNYVATDSIGVQDASGQTTTSADGGYSFSFGPALLGGTIQVSGEDVAGNPLSTVVSYNAIVVSTTSSTSSSSSVSSTFSSSSTSSSSSSSSSSSTSLSSSTSSSSSSISTSSSISSTTISSSTTSQTSASSSSITSNIISSSSVSSSVTSTSIPLSPATSTSTTTSMTTAPNLSAITTFQLNLVSGGGFVCAGSRLVFSESIDITQGSSLTLYSDFTVRCEDQTLTAVRVSLAYVPTKRQVAANLAIPLELMSASSGSSADFQTSFSISGDTLALTNDGISYAFGLTANNLVVIYNPALGVPPNIRSIVLYTIPLPRSSTSNSIASTTAITTTVTDAVVIQNSVTITVNVTVIVLPLATPVISERAIAVVINGIMYTVVEKVTREAITSTLAVGGTTLASSTGLVVIQIVSIVVPVVQVVSGNGKLTTLTSAVTTSGTITSTQNYGASVLSITVVSTAMLTASSTITLSAFIPVATPLTEVSAASSIIVSAGAPVSSATPGANALPALGSGAGKLKYSLLGLAVVLALYV